MLSKGFNLKNISIRHYLVITLLAALFKTLLSKKLTSVSCLCLSYPLPNIKDAYSGDPLQSKDRKFSSTQILNMNHKSDYLFLYIFKLPNSFGLSVSRKNFVVLSFCNLCKILFFDMTQVVDQVSEYSEWLLE